MTSIPAAVPSTRASATASGGKQRPEATATPTFGIMWTILRSIGDISLPFFFSSIHVSSAHLVPAPTTPLIVCSNHSNTILDVAVLASHFPERRPLHFWAKAGFFRNRITRWILTSSGNIKVDRRNKNNQALFEGTFEAMKAGGAIALFPEGGSYTIPKLANLKMGAAWAALEYSRYLQLQEQHDGRTEVKILPAAVVFDNKSVFRSRAVLRFGKPISLDRYIDEFLAAPPPAEGEKSAETAVIKEDGTVPATPESMTRSNTTDTTISATAAAAPIAEQHASPAHRAVARLTADLQRAMQELTFNAPDWETFQAVRMARESIFDSSAHGGAREGMDEYVELSRALMVILTLDTVSPLTTQPDVLEKSQQARRALFAFSSLLHLADVDSATLSRTVATTNARSSFFTPLAALVLRLPVYVPVFAPTLLPTYVVPNALAHHFAAHEEESLSSVKTLFSFFFSTLLYSTLLVKTMQWTRWTPPGLLVGMAGVWWLHDLNRGCVDGAYGLVKQVRFGWRVYRANLPRASAAPLLKAEVKKTRKEGGKSLFFYGTLVHPKILARVIGNDGAHLEVQNAVLDGARLFHVKGEEYPGLLRVESSASNAVNAVKGTLVRGLTASDLRCLDAFEGDEYERLPVSIIPDPLSPVEANSTRIANAGTAPLHAILSGLNKARIETLCASASEGDRVVAEVYTWTAGRDKLEDRIWEFDVFAQTHAANWVGEGEVEHEHEYQVVDRVRSDQLTSTPILTSTNDQPSTSAAPSQADPNQQEWIKSYASTLAEPGRVHEAVVAVCHTLSTQPSIQFYVDRAFKDAKVKRPSKGDAQLVSAVFRARAAARAQVEQLVRMAEEVHVQEVQHAMGVLMDAKARALARVGVRMEGEAAWPFTSEQIDKYAGGASFESRKTV
ncbi:hypothetical protein EX895_000331 [Sporisorium graminicola]|uniref:Phospholipid/glycerol acyltransferase domain-containing protein n=1 Tax=Sporisorium graminicola TaxID=280036 RepID=A0A4U7KZS9_9BASI|nr:hypothetical protein EX895_000331 [Sporisorium graminicola]TKY90333.1 hypothetical protein EX895_000331 [Sporisorium graminicola]